MKHLKFPHKRHGGAAGMLLAAAMSNPAHAGATTQESVVYKTTPRGDLAIDIVRPAGSAPAAPRPCVVFFHGGGWKRGQAHQFVAYSQVLAQRGVIGLNVEYRLMQEGQMIPVEAVEDARSAMRYVRRNAARLGCDPARIGAGGGSSGGHLALMTAVKSPVEDAHDDLAIDPRPALLLLFNAPMNFDDYPSPVPLAERRRFSPYYLIDASFPPTLMQHGTADKVVPFRQVAQFRDKLATLGVNTLKVVPFEGRGHGFFNRGKGQPGDFDRAAGEMVSFLQQQGWIAAGP